MKQEKACLRNLGGFTLVEILIVMAIIGILAALLFPVFASLRRNARQTQCFSNEKQIGTAFEMYRADYDGYWPTGFSRGTKQEFKLAWSVPAYLKIKGESLACPDAVETGANVRGGIPGYAYNAVLDPGRRAIHESKVRFPATTVSLCDAPWGVTDTHWPDPWTHFIRRPSPPPEEAWKRHQGGADYLFCDGHVKWYTPDAVLGDFYGPLQDGSRPSFAILL